MSGAPPCDLPSLSVSFGLPPSESPQLTQSSWALDGGQHQILSVDSRTMQAQRAHAIPDTFPIDARVQEGIKQKIWSNEFIDLAQLLKPKSLCVFDKRKGAIYQMKKLFDNFE